MAVTTADLKNKRAKLYDEMVKLATKDDVSDDEQSRIDELAGQVKKHDERISTLEGITAMAAKDSVAMDDEEDNEKSYGKSFVIGTPKRPSNERKGTRAARLMTARALEKSIAPGAGMHYLKDVLQDTEVTKALSATVTSASGGALIPQEFSSEFIDILRAQTAVRASNPKVLDLDAGNMTIARQSTAAVAYWGVAENADMIKSQQSFDDIQMSAKALTAIVPVSNKLLRRSPINVEQIVIDDMVAQLARAEDIAFLTGATGSATVPPGIVNLCSFNYTSNVVATAANALSTVNGVLTTLEYAVKGSNVNTQSAGWVFSPMVRGYLSQITDGTGRYFFREELSRGTLLGYPYKETTQLATNLGASSNQTQIIFCAWDYALLGQTLNMQSDSTLYGTYIDTGVLVSGYSRDQTVFRIINEVDFSLRNPQAAAVYTVAGWTPFGIAGIAGAPYVTQALNTANSAAGSAVII